MRVFILGLAAATLLSCTKAVPLKAVKAVKADVEETVTTISSGTVEAQQQAVLGFASTGRVAAIHVKAGDVVKAGQTLAELESGDLKSILKEAQAEYQRNQKLYAEKLVSKVALDESRKALEVARAGSTRATIIAPFDGMVTEVNLQLGESVGQGAKPPVRLVDEKPRLLKGEIDEVDLAKVKEGQIARVRIPAAGTKAFEAKVSKVVPFIDTTKEQDRTSQIELQMEATEQRIPVGASAEVEIITNRKGGVIAVPSRLILGSQENRYVFKLAGSSLAKTPVKIGIGNYDRSEILSGLAEGDVVVYPSEDKELSDGLKAKAEIQPWP
jgi:RND family efflux transporter MFP subunit